MVADPAELRGALVVVTGAAGRIGRCLVEALVSAGATVVGLDLARFCPPGDGRYLACDITDETAVRDTVARIVADHGRIDVLVHCAGLSAIGAFEDHDLATHRRVMEVTHFGAVAVTLAALPALRAAAGRIVVVGSVAGFAPVLGRPPYVAAKHAVTGLFTALRAELAPSGVRVTLVHPTFVAGGMTEASDRAPGRERASTGRELTPADVAAAIVAGIAQGRDLVLIGRTAWLSWYVNRLAPGLYVRLMTRRLRATGTAAGRGTPG
ncbi:SDR family oxidoreductase [Plantactinospora sp. KBS50]|uniref:SDR family NAD(P)-dependent oxidoreductase n=1 Tax=Plantactinospora sp. KBS50 TaxID=2024580 RepID=UPI0012FD7DD1|nr:SDR family NAD(P)-dependent oxidoreductase [Plantactinospora sp. KBS50]